MTYKASHDVVEIGICLLKEPIILILLFSTCAPSFETFEQSLFVPIIGSLQPSSAEHLLKQEQRTERSVPSVHRRCGFKVALFKLLALEEQTSTRWIF